ncbi:MAG TPA: hypothetical protein VIS96_07185 [Terrimicrobiaceae bacterium]
MTYTIQIGSGPEQAPEELGLSAAVLTTTSRGMDTLHLGAMRSVDAPAIIAPFQRVTLRADGIVRFVGWLDQAPRAIAPRRESVTYTLSGAWRWLMRTYYKGDIKLGGTVNSNATGLYTLGGGFEDDVPVHITVKDQLEAVLNYARGQTSNAFDFAELPESLDIEIAWENRADDRCANVLNLLLAYVPTAICRWEYDGTTPVIHIVDTAGAPAAQTLQQGNLASVPALNPRYDLLCDVIECKYVSNTNIFIDEAPSNGDAATLAANCKIIYTFPLQDGEPHPQTGLAAKLAEWHQTLHVDANPTFVGALNFGRVPGQLWTFGGMFSALSSYRSICHQIARDLNYERETVTLGVPVVPSTYRLSRRATVITPASTGGGTGGGGGGGGEPEPEEGTVSVRIYGPAGDTNFNVNEVGWSITGTGGGRSGNGDATFNLPVGNYTIGRSYPAGFVDDPTLTNATAFAVTDGGSVNVDTGVKYDKRMRLKDSDAEEAVEIDLFTDDIPAEAGNKEIKVRELDVIHMGAAGKRLFLASESYEL